MNGERVTFASLFVPPPVWRFQVARWETFDDCARALDLTAGELGWFADARSWNRRAPGPLRHYSYRWIPTATGGIRLLERPKPRLAELQRRIGRHVLEALPVHEAAHGFRRGRSAMTCAAPHAGRELVVRMDLEGFFPTVSARRVRSLLLLAGYGEAVAAALAGMLTTATPPEVLANAPDGRRDSVRTRLLTSLAATHLPQGAPSSPAVANAVTHHLDRRLAGLAKALGARYTRYADDLAFSGEADLPLHRLLPGVREIVRGEGFRVREAKTSIAAAHQRQRVAGLVVNASPAVARDNYDDLRALLHNCARTGPEAQNREGHPDFRAHLLGRIGWAGASSPARANRLRAQFDRISWQAP
ncbi:reverse transcriptase family protein [Amycolatopsis sp. H20-H5]|uniref:reverse transcriptase family protein n=1 Tax=Amycolatopsis sp. H20-H5 TaxID=3046309 RepID=UPI002DBCFEEE|nr:reverse transcriptase family protein [Amycolatopsis sp. H20-H5]MEC3982165.1 reverse transcriptase family protein [Amycolatopsis sp. H20-H5]